MESLTYKRNKVEIPKYNFFFRHLCKKKEEEKKRIKMCACENGQRGQHLIWQFFTAHTVQIYLLLKLIFLQTFFSLSTRNESAHN